ncbi:MAG: PhnD/SsuA/transferrin family substrate-binding protein [Gammaproteobacteria bacterium]|nr:PhnD/SsuA/transferrin family substrate-binding protein [Gammaproteobacteria bacterium]
MRDDTVRAWVISMLLVTTAGAKQVAAGPVRVSYQTTPPGQSGRPNAAPWILSASPQGSTSADRALFDPIAHYLTAVTGHDVVYRRPSDDLAFSRNLAAGRYDLVFGGPHLAAWAERHQGAHPLVRFSGSLVFDTVARSPQIHTLAALIGEPVCLKPLPSLATATLLRHFPRLLRQPYQVAVSGWRQAYQGLLQGACRATVLPARDVPPLTAHGALLYVIHQSRRYPGDGLVASPRIPSAARHLIRTALLSPQGQQAAKPLARANAAPGWVAAHRKDYAGLSRLLRHVLFLGN